MRSILFVDDEVRVLEGLKRLLRPMRAEWQMEFERDSRRALELIRQREFDAIVTDMRMPDLDGSQLLALARDIRPGMARIVLSGFVEREAGVRSVGLAHQFLAKPCEAEVLRSTVARSCELRKFLADSSLADTICRLGTLPSLPKFYQAINEEMAREDFSLKRVAQIVSQDIAMTAKVLQIVNSAFFGIGRRVLDIEAAVNYLGADTLRALLLSNAVFSAFSEGQGELLESVWVHSALTGMLAKRLAELEFNDPALHAEAMLAGALHDVGQLVFASRLPREYATLATELHGAHAELSHRERELLAVDHGGVGAYLMGLWGLGDGIVEALAYHHRPGESASRERSVLTMVHAADGLIEEYLGAQAWQPSATHPATPHASSPYLDYAYLDEVGCTERLAVWRAEAEKIVAKHFESAA